ncbi:out at first protein [Lasius niger]|uniref:Out at first protein n=1 Tax=Lasius niger TaxID=67767 RepID=A0A0J7KHF3_LASNI|nr:out at first protein [Lasius niger]
MIVEAKLSKHQYNVIKSVTQECTPTKLFPHYEKILKAKKRCYPEGITITETSAEINLQCLLDHTVQRILLLQHEVLDIVTPVQLSELQLISKWGCDGSSGQSEYKQKFSDETISDASIFITSFVPLQLIVGKPDDKNKIVLWKNPRPFVTTIL